MRRQLLKSSFATLNRRKQIMAFSFLKQFEKDAGSTLVVDALNLAFRWKHNGKTDFIQEYIATVQSLATSYNCEKIIITADQGSSSYRKNLDPGYKQNRKDKYAEQTEEEAAAFKLFFQEYEKTLAALENMYPVLRYDGVEADDIAAHLVKFKGHYGLDTIWLVSSDRDWDLLISDNVSRFSYVTRKEVTKANWSDHYDVSMEEYISLKCLTGDKGDNVPGIPGVGPKRAQGLIEQFGDAMSVYDAVPLSGSYKYIQNVNLHAEQILKNYELMDLITYCDDAIGVDNINDIEEKLLVED
jgi:5'-3' exonuclease